MTHIDYVVRNLDDTARVARLLSDSLPRPLILALTGELGSGKTAFVQKLAAILGIEETVPSPTFTIVNEYPLIDGKLIHADLYRINNMKEINQLGLTDYFILPGTVVAIEWADRATRIFPSSTVWLNFIVTDSHRVIRVTQPGEAMIHFMSLGK